MTKLRVHGRITHMPGPWGASVAGRNYKVQIIDIHPLKATRQVIWEGQTNANGVFKGTTKDWRDMAVFPATLFTPKSVIPDPTDVLLLVIRVTVGGQNYEYPFIFVGDDIQVPVILPLVPPGYNPNADRAILNGVDITDIQALSDALFKAIQAKQPVSLKLYGNWSNAAKPIVDIICETPLKRVQRVFPNTKSGSITIVAGGVAITITAAAILASASLIIAIGAAILLSGVATFVVLLGLAVLVAVLMGYASISASQTSTTNPDGTVSTETDVSFRLN